MKNKEIEELLNTFKELINAYSPDTEPFTIDYDYKIKYSALESLLSYMEQLENLCNKYEQEQKTTFKIWKEDIKKSKQLENNRDKAIDYLEKSKLNQLDTHCKYLHIDFDAEKIENIDELIDILKGDSDE